MTAIASSSSFVQLLYRQPEVVFRYPYIKSLTDLFSVFTWLKGTSSANAFLYSPKLRVSAQNTMHKKNMFGGKRYLSLLRCINQPDAQKKYYYKRKSSKWLVSNRPSFWKPTHSVWSESTLARLESLRLLGFKSYSSSRRRFVPLNLEHNSFTLSDKASQSTIPTRVLTKADLKLLNVQKLLRYLSIRDAHLGLSHDTGLQSTLNLFRRAFRVRMKSRKRPQTPNPYLFLGLKPNFKPKSSLVVDRFKASISKHKYRLRAHSTFHMFSSFNPLARKSVRRVTRNEAYIRRKSLRFLKKYLPKHNLTLNKKKLSIPRSHPKSFSTFHNVSRSAPRIHPNIDLSTYNTSWLQPSKETKLPVRVNPYLSRLKSFRTQFAPLAKLNLLQRRDLGSVLRLIFKHHVTSLFLNSTKRSWGQKFFVKTTPVKKGNKKRWVRNNKFISEINRFNRAAYSHNLKRRVDVVSSCLPCSKLLPQLTVHFHAKCTPFLGNLVAPLQPATLNPLILPEWPLVGLSANSLLVDAVAPIASYGFVRSPFFFTNFWTRNRSGITDVLLLDQRSYTRHSYTIFPEANAMKTTVFRSLVNQRSLQEARVLIFQSNTFKPRSSNTLSPATTQCVTKRGNLYPYTSAISVAGTKSILNRLLSQRRKSLTKYLKPRRIRFKPGYSRLWRIGRTSIKEILDIKAHYQYRLNPQLQSYYHQRRNKRRLLPDLTLELALMKSHYAPDRDAVNSLLNVNGVFLNGIPANNSSTTLFSNDFVQLVVSLKFYIALRWIKTWFLIRKNRVSKVFYRKYRPAPFNKNIRIVRELPRWFFDLEFTGGDLPRCFEMDYFTLSIFVLPYPVTTAKLIPSRSYMFDARILNMYNWKYIT